MTDRITQLEERIKELETYVNGELKLQEFINAILVYRVLKDYGYVINKRLEDEPDSYYVIVYHEKDADGNYNHYLRIFGQKVPVVLMSEFGKVIYKNSIFEVYNYEKELSGGRILVIEGIYIDKATLEEIHKEGKFDKSLEELIEADINANEMFAKED